MQSSSSFSPGSSLQSNRYVVSNLLGQGGMAITYLAKDTRLSNKLVVIKELLSEANTIAQWQEDVRNFHREVSTLAALDHPLIPQVTDHFQEGQHYCMVQTYIEGESLEARLDRQSQPLSEFEVLAYASEILDVLDYLSKQKPPIVHRDIKPANIMIGKKDQRAHLIDFGIARITAHNGPKQTTALGTPGYAPPEQCQGNAELRSDLYALAATMHHLLTNHDPQQENPFTYLPARRLNPQISSEVEVLLTKALSMNVAGRHSSATAMKQEVDTILIRRFGSQHGNIVGHLVNTILRGSSSGSASAAPQNNYVIYQKGAPTIRLRSTTQVLSMNTSSGNSSAVTSNTPPRRKSNIPQKASTPNTSSGQKKNTPKKVPSSVVQSPTHHVYSFTSPGLSLTLECLHAKVRVLPHSLTSQINIEVDGPAESLKQIKVKQERSTVRISDSRYNTIRKNNSGIINMGGIINIGSGNNTNVNVNINGLNIISKGGAIWVNGHLVSGGNTSNEAEDPVMITVNVPKGTALHAKSIDGDLDIGDVAGIIDLVLNGTKKITIGSTTGGSISVLGSGHCTIEHLSGNALDVLVKGSGKVLVRSGNVRVLQGHIKGIGDIQYDHLITENASLSVEGSGKIKVHSGNIKMLQGHIKGIGAIQCDRLITENASLSVTGAGDIYVYRVTNQLSRNVKGVGNVCVGNYR